jgi:hypothetical protein
MMMGDRLGEFVWLRIACAQSGTSLQSIDLFGNRSKSLKPAVWRDIK